MNRSALLFLPFIFLVPVASAQPKIETLLKAKTLKKVLEQKDVVTHAVLDSVGEEKKSYSFYSVMVIGARAALVKQALTDYDVYEKLIPFVEVSNYNLQTRQLHLIGGIWGFQMNSHIEFKEKNDRWITFTFVEGHFKSMTGEIIMQPILNRPRDETLVFLRGQMTGPKDVWPPAFIVEQGAEVVLSYTGKKMRSQIEQMKIKPKGIEEPDGRNNAEKIPQPRSRI